jgi:hypothetical protein
MSPLGCRGDRPIMEQWITPPTGRQWKVIGIG